MGYVKSQNIGTVPKFCKLFSASEEPVPLITVSGLRVKEVLIRRLTLSFTSYAQPSDLKLKAVIAETELLHQLASDLFNPKRLCGTNPSGDKTFACIRTDYLDHRAASHFQ